MKHQSTAIASRTALYIFFLSALFLCIDIFSQSGILYLTGGIIAGTISEILKTIGISDDIDIVLTIWFILLVSATWGYFRNSTKLVSIILLISIFLLLYVVDMIFASYSKEELGLPVLAIQTILAAVKGIYLSAILILKMARNGEKE